MATPALRLSRQPSPLAVAALAVLVGLALGGAIALATPLYVVAALLGLAGGVALLLSVEAGLLIFVGIVTLLPYAVVPVPLGTVRLTFLDVTLTSLLLTWIVRLLARPEERLRGTGVDLAFLAFVGLALTSFTIGLGYSTSPEAMRLFLKWLNSGLLLYTVVNVVRDERRIALVVRALLLGGGAAGALGVLFYLLPRDLTLRAYSLLRPLGYPPAGEMLRTIAGTDTLRATSTSVDPNVFGAVLMVVVAIGVAQLYATRPLLPRRILLALLAPAGAALLLTYSRGSWVALAAALALIVLLRERRWWVAVLVVFVGVALILVQERSPYLEHLVSGFQARDKAAAMRLGEFKDALILIQRYPLFGVGFGRAPEVDLYVGVSSIYLLLAEQVGLLGLAAYLATVGWLLARAFRALRRAPEVPVSGVLLSATAALAGALTAGVFDHHFVNIRFPHVVALFWLLAGLVVVSIRGMGEVEERTQGSLSRR
ncbi:MAG: O-antigen ligase family protein [Chloroflexi bacterium]|nr:O-antigen ligase family protein [Chloroflexota bacterium]